MKMLNRIDPSTGPWGKMEMLIEMLRNHKNSEIWPLFAVENS